MRLVQATEKVARTARAVCSGCSPSSSSDMQQQQWYGHPNVRWAMGLRRAAYQVQHHQHSSPPQLLVRVTMAPLFHCLSFPTLLVLHHDDGADCCAYVHYCSCYSRHRRGVGHRWIIKHGVHQVPVVGVLLRYLVVCS